LQSIWCYSSLYHHLSNVSVLLSWARGAAASAPAKVFGRTMDREWNDNQPIYRQLRDRVVAMILDGVLGEGDPLPSVRNVAAESRINPLTVLKAYEQLVDEGLVEKRRGLGLFINKGAPDLLLTAERERFLSEQWPGIQATIQRLGLTPRELLAAVPPPKTGPKTSGEG
jgi:GntR family transcriptional regulator